MAPLQPLLAHARGKASSKASSKASHPESDAHDDVDPERFRGVRFAVIAGVKSEEARLGLADVDDEIGDQSHNYVLEIRFQRAKPPVPPSGDARGSAGGLKPPMPPTGASAPGTAAAPPGVKAPLDELSPAADAMLGMRAIAAAAGPLVWRAKWTQLVDDFMPAQTSLNIGPKHPLNDDEITESYLPSDAAQKPSNGGGEPTPTADGLLRDGARAVMLVDGVIVWGGCQSAGVSSVPLTAKVRVRSFRGRSPEPQRPSSVCVCVRVPCVGVTTRRAPPLPLSSHPSRPCRAFRPCRRTAISMVSRFRCARHRASDDSALGRARGS